MSEAQDLLLFTHAQKDEHNWSFLAKYDGSYDW